MIAVLDPYHPLDIVEIGDLGHLQENVVATGAPVGIAVVTSGVEGMAIHVITSEGSGEGTEKEIIILEAHIEVGVGAE